MAHRTLGIGKWRARHDRLAARVAHVRRQLVAAREYGAESASIAWVLDMLDGKAPPFREPALDQQADPLTGCLPVTAKPDDA